MPIQRLKQFLDKNQVQYRVISHSPAFTSQEIAQAAYESGKEFAKTVVLKSDGKLMMAVIPADHKIDFEQLKQVLGVRHVALASEGEFKNLFPDCEVGAMPPFGELYGVKVLIDDSFADKDMISFNAGTHREIIKMRYADFDRLVNPQPIKVVVVFN